MHRHANATRIISRKVKKGNPTEEIQLVWTKLATECFYEELPAVCCNCPDIRQLTTREHHQFEHVTMETPSDLGQCLAHDIITPLNRPCRLRGPFRLWLLPGFLVGAEIPPLQCLVSPFPHPSAPWEQLRGCEYIAISRSAGLGADVEESPATGDPFCAQMHGHWTRVPTYLRAICHSSASDEII